MSNVTQGGRNHLKRGEYRLIVRRKGALAFELDVEDDPPVRGDAHMNEVGAAANGAIFGVLLLRPGSWIDERFVLFAAGGATVGYFGFFSHTNLGVSV